MDRSTLLRWLNIGEMYLKYRSDLEKVGFSDADGPTKLIYMDHALAKNDKNDNKRQSGFYRFSTGCYA